MARKRLSPERYRSFPQAGRELIVLEAARQEGLRRQALRELQQAQAELEGLEELERDFVERDRPAFLGWIHSTFAALMQELRKCFDEISEKQMLIDEVQELAAELDVTYPEAYRIILKRRRKAEREAERESKKRAEQDSSDTDDGSQGFEFHQQGDEERFGGEGWEWPAEDEKVPSKPASDILKQLYRELARKLHPDMGGEQSQQTRELWLEVQRAYEERDLQRMQRLAAFCLFGDEKKKGECLSLGELLELTKKLKKSARSLRKKLRGVQEDPAWAFSKLGERRGIRKQAKRELQAELADAQDMLERLNEIIEVLFEAA